MPFFNPYMKGVDIGSGVSDLSGQILQMLMMKKMFPEGSKSMGQTPVPQQGMMGQSQQPPMPSGQMPQQGNFGGDDETIQKIMAALKAFGGGFGG